MKINEQKKNRSRNLQREGAATWKGASWEPEELWNGVSGVSRVGSVVVEAVVAAYKNINEIFLVPTARYFSTRSGGGACACWPLAQTLLTKPLCY